MSATANKADTGSAAMDPVATTDNPEGCVVFTGGGTGGHVYPGLAVIERLGQIWKGRIVWIGSGKDIERKAVEAAGVEFFTVPSGKLRRQPSLENAVDAFKVAAGFFASRTLLASLRPALVFSKGGYVSVPPCMAAASLGIPVITHESDISPGLATKLNARVAMTICTSWEATEEYFDERTRARVVMTGNPVRASIANGTREKGLAWLGFDGTLPVVLVLGGSQGALQVNTMIESILPKLSSIAAVAHQTGPGNAPSRPPDLSYKGFEYVQDEMPDVLAAADIVVGRSGAGTVWEAATAGKPMVLIPLSGPGSRGDQVQNAAEMARHGAAISLAGNAATPEALLDALSSLIRDEKKRNAMAASSSAMARSDAAGTIASMVLKAISSSGHP